MLICKQQGRYAACRKDRQTDRQTDGQIVRQTDGQTEWKDRHTERDIHVHNRTVDPAADWHADCRQIDGHTGRQKDRHTDIQRVTHVQVLLSRVSSGTEVPGPARSSNDS